METHISKPLQKLQMLLRMYTEQPFDKESSSEEDNVEELSDIESEEEAYDMVEDVELSSESEEEGAAHVSTRGSLESCFMYGFKWSVTPPTEEQTEADKVSNYGPQVLGVANKTNTPIEVWSLLFTDEMLGKIVEYTNAEIARKRENYSILENYLYDINLEELQAFIGILYYSGVQKKTYNKIEDLWESTASIVYRCTMPKARYTFLLQCLQFDDKSTRHERRQRDNLAPIRDLWDLFISNCKEYYLPGKHVTIGEQLLYFAGKCPFRVKIGTKPQKCGLKIVMMNDSRTSYVINAIPYVGKVDTRPLESVPTYYVRKLSEPIHKTHRNIICNKRFTSVPLVQSMKNNFSLSMVGAIRAKEREIPLKMKRFTASNDSRFLYANNMTLVSYCPKQNKIVLILSSLRGDIEVRKESDIIQFYNNSIKGGTDAFDQSCRDYRTERISNRWSMRFFYAMLDQSGLNSSILYNLNKEDKKDMIERDKFLKTLALSLIRPFIKSRLRLSSGISDHLRALMKIVIKEEDEEEDTEEDSEDSE